MNNIKVVRRGDLIVITSPDGRAYGIDMTGYVCRK